MRINKKIDKNSSSGNNTSSTTGTTSTSTGSTTSSIGKHAPKNIYRGLGLVAWLLVLAVSFTANMKYGFITISWHDLLAALTSYDSDSYDQIVARTSRLPRAAIAAAVGGSLALAGALMQAVTRNPLASPSVLGVNAGASLAVVAGITVLGIRDMFPLMWLAFLGAGLAAATVYMLGSLGREGLSPLRIVLAGAALTALFNSLTQGMLARNQNGLQDVLFWLSGSVAGRPLELLLAVLPYIGAGWLIALPLGSQLNVLAMGEESAKGLGQRTAIVKLAAGAAVVMLAGGAVAVAGPIGLIGIIVPHTAKYFAGTDYRWLIPYSAVMGAVLLLLADLAARFIIMPVEVPVGIMTAAVGAPFFIYIARKGLKGL